MRLNHPVGILVVGAVAFGVQLGAAQYGGARILRKRRRRVKLRRRSPAALAFNDRMPGEGHRAEHFHAHAD